MVLGSKGDGNFTCWMIWAFTICVGGMESRQKNYRGHYIRAVKESKQQRSKPSKPSRVGFAKSSNVPNFNKSMQAVVMCWQITNSSFEWVVQIPWKSL